MATASLARKKCVPCDSGIPALDAEEIRERLVEVPQWRRGSGNSIRREWKAKDFATAIEFIRRVADIAETENHHPDIHLTGFLNLVIELSTHAIGGLSENDFILAAKIDLLPIELKK